MVLLVQPVEHPFVAIHSCFAPVEPIFDHRDVHLVLDLEEVVVLALPDDVQIEHCFEDVRLEQFAPSVHRIGIWYLLLALYFDEFFEDLHDREVYLFGV